MHNNNIFFTISIPKGMLDNDYTFYEDGRVKHFYDKNSYSLNITEWIEAKDIRHSDKKLILENCDESLKYRLCQLMDVNLDL